MDQIVQWSGSGGNRQALVQWLGFNVSTGEPWGESWVPRSHLTADLRSGGIIRRRRTADEIRDDHQREEAQYEGRQRRRTPRLAGEVPGRGL